MGPAARRVFLACLIESFRRVTPKCHTCPSRARKRLAIDASYMAKCRHKAKSWQRAALIWGAALAIWAILVSSPCRLIARAAAQDAAVAVIASARSGRPDVPRVELAARLLAAGLQASDAFTTMRANAARELAGRPDETGAVTAAELAAADAAIAREKAPGGNTPPSFCALARAPGRPQIPGLRMVYLMPLGAPGAARSLAAAQFANPTNRGVTLWVETDGTVYWATSESAIPTHSDGANRNDNKYIDNAPTYHA